MKVLDKVQLDYLAELAKPKSQARGGPPPRATISSQVHDVHDTHDDPHAQTMASSLSTLVDFSKSSLLISVAAIAFNPTAWNIVARNGASSPPSRHVYGPLTLRAHRASFYAQSTGTRR